jgi:hypothetical protein
VRFDLRGAGCDIVRLVNGQAATATHSQPAHSASGMYIYIATVKWQLWHIVVLSGCQPNRRSARVAWPRCPGVRSAVLFAGFPPGTTGTGKPACSAAIATGKAAPGSICAKGMHVGRAWGGAGVVALLDQRE